MSTPTQPAAMPTARPEPREQRRPSVQTTTIAAVTVVAVVAAVISYSHMQELAAHAGEGWRSHLLPLSVDGQLVAASMAMLVRRRAGRRPGWLVYGALAAGIAASLAANVASPLTAGEALPRWVPALLAAWPPVALVLAYELLMSLVQRPAPPEPQQVTAAPAEATPTPHQSSHTPDAVEIPDPVLEPAPTTTQPAETAAAEASAPMASPRANRSDVQEAARQTYREIRAAGDRTTGLALGQLYGRSDSWGRARMREVKDHDQQTGYQLRLVDEQEIRA